jgi:membrane complex biogenesis BtpA family protein
MGNKARKQWESAYSLAVQGGGGMNAAQFRLLFGVEHPLIGMVHLLPLPGSPRFEGEFEQVVERARAEAALLVETGFHGLMVENFNDVPFYPDRVPAETVAAMTVAVREVTAAVGVPVGVNVLRNDGAAALAVAVATGAQFIRVNVLTGAMVTDQGIVSGKAHELLRLRRSLGSPIRIFADVLVKHAQPLGPLPIQQAAEEIVGRGLADALIVTGSGTGKPADLEEARAVRRVLPDVPLLVGSGVTAGTLRNCLETADGVIVGSDLKQGGRADSPVDRDRVTAIVEAWRRLGH